MLPKTFDPQSFESRHYSAWEKSGAFAARVQSNQTPYTIMMPPPNVTGSLHMGHALTFTIQDILIRYHRMHGRDALWQPGTDHAGIATQMVVERQLEAQGQSRHTLGREQFIEKIWQWKKESGGTIVKQLRHLGASPDWERERFTMDEGLSQAVRKVFVTLYREGLIYRDKRLVNWDPKLQTAISDLEVVQKEIKGYLWHLRYPLENEPGRYITVATTRPETMLGDTGIVVHPDDERYQELIGKYAILPLVGRRLRIVGDAYADPAEGSGAVKITPAHDFNDFDIGRRHGLDLINIFDANACLNDSVPEVYRGMDRFAARRKILEDLESQGLLEKVEDRVLTVPHGDRSGVIVEPFLTDQWFADAKTLAEPAIKAVEEGKTRIVPKQWETTYFEWMRNIQPWCISRQIWWGHQIPAWYGPDGQVFVGMDEAEALDAANKHYGEAVPLKRDSDVLDTWFSSALWPFSTLGWPDQTDELKRYYPGDTLVTGFDILFFWVARMMMMGLHFMKEVPFRTVYIHALVRDQQGQKMSKSKGNIIDPLEVISKYGSDALRFTLAALAAQGRDIKLSEHRVENYRNFATKIWNAARFCEMNSCRYDSELDPSKVKFIVNRWLVSRLIKAAGTIDTALDDYRFNAAAHHLYHFIWHEFCDWYLELAKPALQGDDPAIKAETQSVTGWALAQILHLLHPVMPFITEELWDHLAPGAEDLIANRWPDYSHVQSSPDAEAEIEWLISLITEIRSARSEMNIPAASRLPLLVHDDNKAINALSAKYSQALAQLARVSEVSVSRDSPAKGSLTLVIADITYSIPVAGSIDLKQERERLRREADKLSAEAEKIHMKLENPQFISRAAPDVIEEQRERLTEVRATHERLSVTLKRLEEAL